MGITVGVESTESETVLPCVQSAFDDLRSLTGGPRHPICVYLLTVRRKIETAFIYCASLFRTHGRSLNLPLPHLALYDPTVVSAPLPPSGGGRSSKNV